MPDELISIIVPCYNLEKYLSRCIDSILGQTYQNLEIIAVDDGSTDETPELLAAYASADKRLSVLRRVHAGAGAAVNEALRHVHGEFLAFVDNDDWIEPAMYQKLYDALRANDADMAVCNFNLAYPDHTEFCYSAMQNGTVTVHEDVYGYYCRYCACQRPNNYIWSRLYRTKTVQNAGVRFEQFLLGADTLFNFKLLPHINRVSFINDGLYNYTQRSDSSVYSVANRCNIAEVYADGFETLAEYYEKFPDFRCILPMHAFTRLRSIFFYSRLAGLSEEEVMENIKVGFKGRKITGYLTGALK